MTGHPPPEAAPGLAVAEAEARLNEAQQALRAAQHVHDQALQVLAEAKAQQAEGRHLAQLAMAGNPVAMRTLDEQVRAMHPGIAGYLPVPDANDTPGHWYAEMEDLGLRLDLPMEVDAEYVAGLATALREFVRRYEPKIGSQKARSGTMGRAYAETRAGTLVYGTNPKRPAVLRHLRGILDDGPGPADEEFATLEEALAAIPPLVLLTALDGRRYLDYKRP